MAVPARPGYGLVVLARRHLRLPPPRTSDLAADVLVVVAVLAAAALDRVWNLGGQPGWRWVAAALLTAAVLLLRRRAPLAALGGVFAIWIAVHTPDASDDPFFQFVALVVAAYALGAHASRRHGLAGLVLAAAGFAALNLDRGEDAGAAVAGAIQFSVMFVFGALLSRATARERALEQRAARHEAEREERARAAVADERARIARDLHDALGHTISTSVLQVSAVRRRLGEDQRAERDALLSVERSGRDSVTELRRMLGMLREEEGNGLAPLPSLARVEELAKSMRTAGVPVEVRVEGESRSVPAGVDIAGYRIVQEALTNVLKHAGDARARVRVGYEPDAVVLEVADDGPAGPDAHPEPGHGLIGMRERVALYGGELQTGPGRAGGYTVTARLPFGRDSS
jgi:signal transduction histidine kinase